MNTKNFHVPGTHTTLTLFRQLTYGIITLCLSQRVIILKKEQNISLKSLAEQLQWCKEQGEILEKIETALYEMKGIAEYATENKLDSFEANELNGKINQLKKEVTVLEKQLHLSQAHLLN